MSQIEGLEREAVMLRREKTELETNLRRQKVLINSLMEGADGYEKTIAGLQAENGRLRKVLTENQVNAAKEKEECLDIITVHESYAKGMEVRCEKMAKLVEELAKRVGGCDSKKSEKCIEKSGLEAKPIGTEISTKKWPDLITHPSVIVIIGRRGSGKTVLGFCILRSFAGALKLFVFGFPEEKKQLLSPGVDILERLEDAPEDSAVLIDEASLRFHSRRSQADESVEVSRLINLSRHRRLTLIFISQEGRQIDVNIISAANAFAIKEPAMAQVDFDRPQLRGLIKNAATHFDGMPQEERKKFTYFHSKDTGVSGLVPVEPPLGWSDELSRAFAGVSCGPQQGKTGKTVIPAGMMPKKEKVRQVRELKKQGFSYGEIAGILSISKQTAKNYNER